MPRLIASQSAIAVSARQQALRISPECGIVAVLKIEIWERGSAIFLLPLLALPLTADESR